MAYATLKLEYEPELVILTFSRPEKRNAISPEMLEELMAALDELDNSQARVGIITGAGKAFCAGMDLESLRTLAAEPAGLREPSTSGVLDVTVRVLKGTTEEGPSPQSGELPPSEAAREDSRRMARLFRRLYEFPKPLIAAVNGPAVAGGCGIATLCDFTLAAPEAKFGYTEVRIGFLPALVSIFLVRQIGEKRARDLLLTGRIINAEEARQLGLVNEVVANDRLIAKARELAAQLLESSPTSLAYTKRLLRELSQKELERALELAIEANASIRSTADFREGISAFLEKRKAVWAGEDPKP